jgi:Rrf2 family protein
VKKLLHKKIIISFIYQIILYLCPMFSKSCEYAIKAMIYVAQRSNKGEKAGVKDIAKNTDAPEHFVGKIMQDLAKRKVVKSIKGPNGGFYLDKNDMQVSIADIVKATDGLGLYTDCVLGLKVCNEKKPCPVHYEYKEIKKHFIEMLEHNNLESFNEKLLSGKFFLKNN